jgi:hypothetical protein
LTILPNSGGLAGLAFPNNFSGRLEQMTVFPKGKHDDQVDSTAQFLDWFKRPFPGQGFFENMRRLRSVSALARLLRAMAEVLAEETAAA